MLFEIINPSDPYTIEAPDLEIATVACVALGNGQYAFKPLDGGTEVPLFLFGGHDEFCKEHFDTDLDGTIKHVLGERSPELADCCDSVLIGDREAREQYVRDLEDIAPADRATFREHRHENRRTSLNDIGARAYRIAAKLREPDGAGAA